MQKRIQELAMIGIHRNPQIAEKLGVSRSSVHRVLKANPKANNWKRGRPEVMDARDRRAIARYVEKHPFTSIATAITKTNIAATASTVRRNLKRMEFVVKNIKKEKGITKKNQEIRL